MQVSKRIVPVRNCRNIGKKDMILNDLCPEIRVDPQTYQVQINCEISSSGSSTTTASSSGVSPISFRSELINGNAVKGGSFEQTSSNHLTKEGTNFALRLPVDRCSSFHKTSPSMNKLDEIQKNDGIITQDVDLNEENETKKEPMNTDVDLLRPTQEMKRNPGRELEQDTQGVLSPSGDSVSSSVWVALECEAAEVLPLAQRYLLF